jgi:argininosuccinate lyase
LTTNLLGFDDLNYNVVYAQMSRGKTEKILSQSLANIAATLSRMSMDSCIYLNQNFAFISFPDELTTGSSIMPHKKNPDVFELIRAHCNRIQSLPNEISLMLANLTSGYHRDLQLLKESLFPAIKNLKDCIRMATLMFENIDIRKDILEDEKYTYLFTVEEMNKLVLQGMPLRDAYKKIGADVENKTFETNKKLHHTHEGSIGNLQNEEIKKMMEHVISRFNFKEVNDALQKLLQ